MHTSGRCIAIAASVFVLLFAACSSGPDPDVATNGGDSGAEEVEVTTYRPNEYDHSVFRPLRQRIVIARHPLTGAAPDYPNVEARDGQLVVIGVVDWEAGTYTTPGVAPIKGRGAAAAKARRAARVKATANAVKLAGGLQLDEDRTLAVRTGEINVEGHVKGADFTNARTSNGWACITCTVEIHGVSGLGASVFDAERGTYERLAAVYTPGGELALEGEVTDVVIDARDSSLEPGLMPKIWTSEGELVYDLQSTFPAATNSAGMCEYVVCDDELGALIRRLKLPRGRNVRLALANPFDLGTMLAQRRRRGKRKVRPVVVKNIERGKKIDVLVSEQDAAKIAAADKQSGVLKNARVIVVVGSQVAGKRGALPRVIRVARR